jgi:hypothetical protein
MENTNKKEQYIVHLFIQTTNNVQGKKGRQYIFMYVSSIAKSYNFFYLFNATRFEQVHISVCGIGLHTSHGVNNYVSKIKCYSLHLVHGTTRYRLHLEQPYSVL